MNVFWIPPTLRISDHFVILDIFIPHLPGEGVSILWKLVLPLGLVSPTWRQITWIDWQLKSQKKMPLRMSEHMPGRTSFGDRSKNVFFFWQQI